MRSARADRARAERMERRGCGFKLLAERVERLLETVRVRTLRLRERFEPVGDFLEAFAASGLRHARVHVRVLVRLARDRGLQIVARLADRQARGRIADGLEVLEVAVRVPR